MLSFCFSVSCRASSHASVGSQMGQHRCIDYLVELIERGTLAWVLMADMPLLRAVAGRWKLFGPAAGLRCSTPTPFNNAHARHDVNIGGSNVEETAPFSPCFSTRGSFVALQAGFLSHF